MKNIFLISALLLPLISTPISAQALKYTVGKGKEIRIAGHSFFNGKCKKTKKAHFKVPKKLKFGQVKVHYQPVEIKRVNEGTLKHCIGKTVEGAVVNYTAGTTAGVDSFSISRKTQGGSYRKIGIVITVR